MSLPPDQVPNSLGRLVVFVRPHSVVQNELLADLIRNEFAVAVLHDHTRVRDLFHRNPDCIAFFNIDEGYSEPEWATLVRTLEDDPDIQQVRIGILTYNPNPELSQKYLLELMVSCGFVRLSLELTESTKTIIKLLEANEARGRRQHLRVPCSKGTASLNVLIDGDPLVGALVDLSSVGMACTFDRDPKWKARTLIKSIQLRLKGVLCQVSAIVMGSRITEGGETIFVLLFDPKTPEDVREKIRAFLGKALQAQLDGDLGTSRTN